MDEFAVTKRSPTLPESHTVNLADIYRMESYRSYTGEGLKDRVHEEVKSERDQPMQQ